MSHGVSLLIELGILDDLGKHFGSFTIDQR